MEDQWLIVHTPRGPHLWQLGSVAQDKLDDLLLRARVLLAVPPGDDWMTGADWRLGLTFGEPHPELLARATRHAVDELAAVTAEALAAYTASDRAATEEQQKADARAWWSSLDPALRAELAAELPAAADAAERKR